MITCETQMLHILHQINQGMYKEGYGLTLGQIESLAKRLSAALCEASAALCEAKEKP